MIRVINNTIDKHSHVYAFTYYFVLFMFLHQNQNPEFVYTIVKPEIRFEQRPQ